MEHVVLINFYYAPHLFNKNKTKSALDEHYNNDTDAKNRLTCNEIGNAVSVCIKHYTSAYLVEIGRVSSNA